MAELGRLNTLEVLKRLDHGIYVDAGELGEILVPKRDVPADCKIGDMIEVFIYTDSEDCFIATTEKPYAMVGEFACLTVLETTAIGAFLDWGLAKDLLVPFAEQRRAMVQGQDYMVFVLLDPKTERIVASTKLHRYLDQDALNVERGDAVDLLICEESTVGYVAMINLTGLGLIHSGDVFTEIEIGQECRGYVKKVRDDGKIDLSLQAPGYQMIKGAAGDILTKMEAAGGTISVSDKSPPELIYETFGISKKAFKKAIGRLYKERLIVIDKASIRLPPKA